MIEHFFTALFMPRRKIEKKGQVVSFIISKEGENGCRLALLLRWRRLGWRLESWIC